MIERHAIVLLMISWDDTFVGFSQSIRKMSVWICSMILSSTVRFAHTKIVRKNA